MNSTEGSFLCSHAKKCAKSVQKSRNWTHHYIIAEIWTSNFVYNCMLSFNANLASDVVPTLIYPATAIKNNCCIQGEVGPSWTQAQIWWFQGIKRDFSFQVPYSQSRKLYRKVCRKSVQKKQKFDTLLPKSEQQILLTIACYTLVLIKLMRFNRVKSTNRL